MRQRATNHARTNECDLVARHFSVSFTIKPSIKIAADPLQGQPLPPIA
jgi:hypothetical protein